MPYAWGRLVLIAGFTVAYVATATPAQARAPLTSTGVRCTIVGTARSEVLVGTKHHDVICGRGGNDVIRGGGGSDVIDGGTGSDRILAGAGNDLVIGGTGSDTVDGGSNDDRILTGPGADAVSGGSGNDHLDGGADSDRLSGGSGADAISGADGADVIAGDAGPDTIAGGGQDDVINGGTENDDLSGDAGDDSLTGGAGNDDLDGGSGENKCVVDSSDTVVRCHYDKEPPQVLAVVVAPGSVDVTSSDAEVEVRVHATDDSAVADVQGYLSAGNNTTSLALGHIALVGGTAADGWWAGTVTVPRWTPAGTLHADIHVTDRLGRNWDDSTARLQVTSSDPDTEGPQLTLTRLTPTAVDVRTASQTVSVAVRGVDAKAGVARVDLCISGPGTPKSYLPFPLYQEVACQEGIPRSSGTSADGTWKAVLTIPRDSVGATYNVVAYAEDRIGNHSRWFGPEGYAAWVNGHWCCSEAHPFADGAGRVEVTGQIADATPAWVSDVTASKTTFDTLAGDDIVHIRVHALDATGPGEGVTAVEAELDSAQVGGQLFDRAVLRLTSGTTSDGWWEGDVVARQGTPPGVYHLLVIMGDRAHGAIYTDPGHPLADSVTYQPLAGLPTFTVVDAE
ncbi:calcium-binding protein [Nocardioides panacihumi]